MEMSSNNGQKFNLFLGDINKLIHGPTQQNILKELLSNESKEYIFINSSLNLHEIVQNLLNDVVYREREIIDKLCNIFLEKPKYSPVFYKNILDSSFFSTIISTSYDRLLEDNFYSYIKKIVPFKNFEEANNKIPFYKIYGDLNEYQKSIFSSQSMKIVKLLPTYNKFWEDIRKQLKKNPTIILGVNLKDKYAIENLKYILSPIINNYKKIYFYTKEANFSDDILDFLNKYSIEIINGEDENFLNNIKEKFFEKQGDVSQEYA